MPDAPDRFMTPEELGEYVRELRGDVSQAAAAEAVGVHQSQVSRAERGETKYMATLARLAEHYSGRRLTGPFYRLDDG